LIFGLRMNQGVDVAMWRDRVPDAPWGAVEDVLGMLAENELLVRDGGRVRLTDRGRLVADGIGSEIMAAFEPAGAAL